MALPVAFGAIIAGGGLVLARYLIPQLVVYVLVSLGIGFVTYVGTQEIIEFGLDLVSQRIDQLPSNLVGILELAGIFDAFSILTAGVTTSLTVMAIASVTRLRFKGIPSTFQ